MSTTLDSEEERVIEAGKEEWRQRASSSVPDIRILPSPNERHMGEVLGEEKKRRAGWSLAGGEQMREVREYITSAPDYLKLIPMNLYYIKCFYKVYLALLFFFSFLKFRAF